MRASLVRQATLADIATSLSLSDYLKLGEGEMKSGGFRRPSILSDALEAIFGAVFLDGGFDAAYQVIARQYRVVLSDIDPLTLGKDPKTLLQELLQARRLALPVYTVINTHGAAHDQLFEVECRIAKLDITVQANGSSRRSAEQSAAELAIQAVQRLAPVATVKKSKGQTANARARRA